MDDLTPLEPEYHEIPPEQPLQTPDYYGTGVQPRPKKSKMPLILTLLSILLAANLVTAAVSLFMEAEPTKTVHKENEPLLSVDEFSVEFDRKNGQTHFENDATMLKDIYEHYAPGTVVITAQTDHTLHCATGVILTSDGYILTDADIFDYMSSLKATLYDGTTCDAAFVGMDPVNEMMILKIDRRDLPTVALDEEIGQQAEALLQEFLESVARPASLNLEVSEVPRPMQIYWGLPEGVIINRMSSSGNAYLAGLRPGDVLLRIGQIAVTSVSDYLEALNSYQAGQTVRIYLYREGKTYYVDLCLEAAQ